MKRLYKTVIMGVLGIILAAVPALAADHTVIQQPAMEETAAVQPATEQPVTEEPGTEEAATEQPVTEEPATEQPATEEPATEEAATEQPSARETATEQPADPDSDNCESIPVISEIRSEDDGLHITWSCIPGADKYVLFRLGPDGKVKKAAILPDVAEPADPAVFPLPAVGPSGTAVKDNPDNPEMVTGYSFTDSLIVPGTKYRYYVCGYNSENKRYSSYEKEGCSGTWNVTASQIRAGTQLTEEAVEHLGVDSFFYAEEISEATMARMIGKSYKIDCGVPWESLRYIRCLHRNAGNEIKVGELVMYTGVADQVCNIFRELYNQSYPIESMLLVDDFDASDDNSILHNNTSAFNYRTVDNTSQISDHAYGRAIDINPFYNVYYIPSENYVFPNPQGWEYIDRTEALRAQYPYVLLEGDLCYTLFINAGFSWGGYFGYNIDYQHFYYTGS